MEDLRYPLGRFAPKGSALTAEERVDLLAGIAALPRELRAAVAGLTDERLDVPYREGVKECKITEGVIVNKEPPLLSFEKEKKLA